MPRADAYFDSVAGEYQERSSRGVWRWLRDREMRTVMELLDAKPGEHILDAGCGAGIYTEAIARAGATPVAFDSSEAMLEKVRERLNVETLRGDFESYPFTPEYDKVLCAGALEFTADPRQALLNLLNALRISKSAKAVIHLPGAGIGARLYRHFHSRHGVAIHLFDEPAIAGLLAGSGFIVQDRRRSAFNWVLRIAPDSHAS